MLPPRQQHSRAQRQARPKLKPTILPVLPEKLPKLTLLNKDNRKIDHIIAATPTTIQIQNITLNNQPIPAHFLQNTTLTLVSQVNGKHNLILAQPKILQKNDTALRKSFTPHLPAGPYSLHANIGTTALDGSPFHLSVIAGRPCAKLSSLNLPIDAPAPRAGMPSEFVLQLKDVCGNSIQQGGAEISSALLPSKSERLVDLCEGSRCKVRDRMDGSYSISLCANMAGEYSLLAWVRGDEVPTYMKFSVFAGQLSVSQSTCRSIGSGWSAGSRASFQIEPRDKYGNRCSGGEWKISIRSPNSMVDSAAKKAERAVSVKIDSGKCEVSTTFDVAGEYVLSVYGRSDLTMVPEHARGSPFSVIVGGGAADPMGCTASPEIPGGKVVAGQPSVWYIVARDVNGTVLPASAVRDSLTVWLSSWPGGSVESAGQQLARASTVYSLGNEEGFTLELSCDGRGEQAHSTRLSLDDHALLQVTSQRAGRFALHVNVNDESIACSPFLLTVLPAKASLHKSSLSGWPCGTMSAGDKRIAHLVCRDTFGNMIRSDTSVKLLLRSGSSTQSLPVQCKDDGTYSLFLEPTVAGFFEPFVGLDGFPLPRAVTPSIRVVASVPKRARLIANPIHQVNDSSVPRIPRDSTVDFDLLVEDAFGNRVANLSTALRGECTGENLPPCPVPIISRADATYSVIFTAPAKLGAYKLAAYLERDAQSRCLAEESFVVLMT